ncbi:MAG TPA: calcium-binding protein, partial [Actinomycetota bacterium]|nr:calcium-binding protein [Actinomycetota bacterium]
MSTLIIDRIDLFTPGATVESPGDQPSEIEFTVDLGDSGDYVWVSSSGAASMALGTDGLNYNAGAESPGDVDVELAGVESFLLFGTAADDSLHADGSGNTGAPATMMVQMVGDDGKDVFVGGSGPDYFAGESGNDVFEGGPGNDRMRFYATSGVQVDLDAGTATGEGSDVMSEVEEVVGTPGNDVIRGTAGADTLYGQEGDDVLEGRGGSDWLDGGDGADRASYASAPSYVWVDLAVPGPQDTHGAGSDVLESIEGLVGSAFSDILSGTSGPDHLEGGPFRDTLVPRAGDDTVDGGSGKDLLLYEGAEAVTVNLVAGRATGQGDDRLSSIESVQGTDGDDTFIASAGSNIFEGGAGFDTLSYARAGGGVTVDLAVAGAQATGGSGSDALAGVEKLIGSRFGDRRRRA